MLGGFSMGSVMSYSLGLAPDRPAPAGILAFSGFIPTVEGWHPDLDGRKHTRVFIAHGRSDPVMKRRVRPHRSATAGGGRPAGHLRVDAAHHIDRSVRPARLAARNAA